MNEKKVPDEVRIAKYKVDAAERRMLSKTKTKSPLAVQPKEGVITVRFGADAKPLSALGGVVETLCHSRFSIPEFKRRQS